MAPSWTTENEELLEKLRINCVNLSEYHRKRYYYFKGYSNFKPYRTRMVTSNEAEEVYAVLDEVLDTFATQEVL